jgi:hypothetical protein
MEVTEVHASTAARAFRREDVDGGEWIGVFLANYLNGGPNRRDTGKAIARGIAQDHRTLQQMAVAVLVQALAHYHKEVGGTDARNDAAFKFSRAFYQWVEAGEGSELFPFPFI